MAGCLLIKLRTFKKSNLQDPNAKRSTKLKVVEAARKRGTMLKNLANKINTFCSIQLEILKERESSLRKQLLECKIQKEFLESMIQDLSRGSDEETQN